MEKGILEKTLKKIKLNESSVSTFLGTLVVIVIGLLLFNYFKNLNRNLVETPLEEKTQEELSEEASVLDSLPEEYLVKKGDDLWKIAERFYSSGYKWVEIAKANQIVNPNLIEAGQKLSLPESVSETMIQEQPKELNEAIEQENYVVKKGDDLWHIAVRAYGDGYQWVKIARANRLANPDLIHAGNQLIIPR